MCVAMIMRSMIVRVPMCSMIMRMSVLVGGFRRRCRWGETVDELDAHDTGWTADASEDDNIPFQRSAAVGIGCEMSPRLRLRLANHIFITLVSRMKRSPEALVSYSSSDD
jgi:hypothetical protein